MANVYANGLEISGKASGGKTIAAFPDTCMTPPENPATPPGVPVPYPSFGAGGDTDKGTGTVKIKGKEVNIKNKSLLTKTTGTEAGSAAKKGVVSSKNTGKGYFNSWSPNVKFDSEPVIRMSDLATNNHASPVGNAPPWAHVLKLAKALADCDFVRKKLKLHQHQDKKCPPTQQSEHTVRVQTVARQRDPEVQCGRHKNYTAANAPCICMQSKWPRRHLPKRRWPTKNADHYKKTMAVNRYLKKKKKGCKGVSSRCKSTCVIPTIGMMVDESVKQTVAHDRMLKKASKSERAKATKCLKVINLIFLSGEADENDTKTERRRKNTETRAKKICAKAICSKPASAGCGSCGAAAM